MKIEIESTDLTSLQNQIEALTLENKKLRDEIKSLKPDELRKEAERLGWKLANDYLRAVFTKLGFEEKYCDQVLYEDSLSHWIGKNWYEQQKKIDLEVDIRIINEMRKVILRLGVVTNTN